MPQGYGFKSVAGGAGDAMLQLLAERKLEERQKMIDDLSRQNIESQMADRVSARELQGANTQALQAQRDAFTADRQAQTAARAATLKAREDLSPVAASDVPTGMEPEGQKSFGVLDTPVQPGHPGIMAFVDPEGKLTTEGRTKVALAGLNPQEIDREFAPPREVAAPKRVIPASAQEFEYAKEQGYPGTYQQYQNEDANRKKSTTNINVTPPNTLGQDDIDVYARAFAKGGHLPPLGRGGITSEIGQAISKRVKQYDAATDTFKEGNTNPPDIVGAKSTLAALTKTEKDLTSNLNAVTAFTQTAEYNGKLLTDAMAKIPDTGIPWLNTPVRAISEKLLGDPAMAEFETARQSVVAEFGRILNNANLSGVLTVSAKKDMEEAMRPNATPQQMLGALKTLKAEAANRHKSYGDQLKDVQSQIKGGGGSAPSEVPAEAPIVKWTRDAQGRPVKVQQ